MLILGAGLALLALFILIVLVLAIIVIVIVGLIYFLPAAIIAFVVWLLTKDLFLAGVAFIIIAVLMIIVRR